MWSKNKRTTFLLLCSLFGVSQVLKAHQYAQKYKVVVSTDGGLTYWTAGEVTRIPHNVLINRYFSIQVSMHPHKNVISEQDFFTVATCEQADEACAQDSPGASANSETFRQRVFSSDSLRGRRDTLSRWGAEHLGSVDGHPVSFLKTLCQRENRAGVEVTGSRYSEGLGLLSMLTLSVMDKMAPEGMSVLKKCYSYAFTHQPNWSEAQQLPSAQVRDTYPTKSEWVERNHGTPENLKESFEPGMAGQPLFRSREMLVVNNELPGLKPMLTPGGTQVIDKFGRLRFESGEHSVLDGKGGHINEKLFREVLIKRVYLDALNAETQRKRLESDHAMMLFLTSTDEESLYSAKYLVLPFPHILAHSVEDVARAKKDDKPLFQMPVIKLEPVSYATPLGGFQITGRVVQEPDYQHGFDQDMAYGKTVSIVYTLSDSRDYWSQISFEFADQAGGGQAVIAFQAIEDRKKRTVKTRSAPFEERLKEGAAHYEDIWYFSASVEPESM